MKNCKIADGMSLNLLQTDKFKTNFISFFFSVPLKRETASEYSIIPKVLLRGSKKYPDMMSISKKLDNLYGAQVFSAVFKRGDTQVIGIFASCLCNEYAFEKTDILNELINTVGELLFEPKVENGEFYAPYVDGEKKNQTDYIKAQINNKNQYALKRCQKEMCAGEAYGLDEWGDIDKIEKITPASLYKAYRQFIATAGIDVFFVGTCDQEGLKSRISDMLCSLERRQHVDIKPEIITEVKEVKNVLEEMNITQGKLTLGFRTGSSFYDKDYAAFLLFNEIFGGTPSGKLFMNVREKLSLCYYCSSIPEAHKGLLFVASGIEVSNKDKAQSEILAQLEEVKKGNISDAEFDSAVKALINGYSELYDEPQNLCMWHYSRFLAGRFETPDDVCNEIRSLTKQDAVRAAQKVKLDTVYFLKGAKQ